MDKLVIFISFILERMLVSFDLLDYSSDALHNCMSVPISPVPSNFSISLVQFRQRSNCISITKVSVNYVFFLYYFFLLTQFQKLIPLANWNKTFLGPKPSFQKSCKKQHKKFVINRKISSLFLNQGLSVTDVITCRKASLQGRTR